MTIQHYTVHGSTHTEHRTGMKSLADIVRRSIAALDDNGATKALPDKEAINANCPF